MLCRIIIFQFYLYINSHQLYHQNSISAFKYIASKTTGAIRLTCKITQLDLENHSIIINIFFFSRYVYRVSVKNVPLLIEK